MEGNERASDRYHTPGVKPGSRRKVPAGLGRWQRASAAIFGWAFAWHAHMKVSGAEHIPRSGPVIIAANHRSMLDVPLLLLASPRPVYFMAKSDIFANRFWASFFHALGGFPVRRAIADVRALDTALAVLERRDAVGIYPEGTRSRSGEMLPLLGGAAWLALRTGAPIVPCGLTGTAGPYMGRDLASLSERQQLWHAVAPRRVTISFGPPIPVAKVTSAALRKRQIPELTDRLLAQIEALSDRTP